VTSRRRFAFAIVTVVVAVVSAACGGGGGTVSGSSASTAPTTTRVTVTTHGTPTVQVMTAPWTLPAPVGREIVLADGKQLVVAGGIDSSMQSTKSVVRVDPSTGTSQAAGPLLTAVHDAAGAVVGSNVLVFGGGGPSENGSTDVQSLPPSGATTVVGHLPVSRSDHVAATIGASVYVLGGFDGTNLVADVLATTDGSAFTPVTKLLVPVRYPAVAVVGTSLYVFGGVSTLQGMDTAVVQRFDPGRRVVEQVATLPTTLSHASAVVLGGQVYLLGGYVNSTQLSDQILRFDPTTLTSTVVGHLPAPLSDGGAAVIDTHGYLVGGQGTSRAPVSSVEIITAG
jgi:hypothetical protein